MSFASYQEILEGAQILQQRINLCKQLGVHLGPESVIGQTGGRFSSRVSVQCGHCGLVYRRHMNREEHARETSIYNTEFVE
ncbi:hypothetical protein ACFLQN_04545 [Candidatus Aenigmatarchaeota archaeon]